jgi:hypothetical protein
VQSTRTRQVAVLQAATRNQPRADFRLAIRAGKHAFGHRPDYR